MRYFKGYNKTTDRHIFCILYDKPQEDKLFNSEPYIAEYGYMDESGRHYANTFEELEKDFYLSREIGKEEYNLYYNIQQLITEFYMNQITGGFPSKSVETCGRLLDHQIRKAYKEVMPKDISVAEALANAMANSLKNDIENAEVIYE